VSRDVLSRLSSANVHDGDAALRPRRVGVVERRLGEQQHLGAGVGGVQRRRRRRRCLLPITNTSVRSSGVARRSNGASRGGE
jgi:hypothetical protein